ncbi:MAG TPA: RNA 2',3'-cyclic phosphodiesterase, partial [Bacteroidales bacterium]|nr:RNA 2',3'-cyclic phosphodiesterase [Bacteroidales bacterium]
IFRDIDDPRIVWIGMDMSDDLIKLNSMIITGLQETGFPVEKRSFSPHITIGRVRRNSGGSKKMFSEFLDDYSNTVFQSVYVDRIILYESILLPSGPVYKPLHIFSLS